MKIIFETGDPVIAKHFAVEPLKRNIPTWYKELDPHIEPGGDSLEAMTRLGGMHRNMTLRHCVPVLDYLTSGFLIKNSIHLKIKNGEGADGERGLTYVTSHRDMVEHHSNRQCPVHIGGKRLTYPKLSNPWRIITPPGYSCLFYQPFYADIETRLRLFPAIVDTDTYPMAVNFPGYVMGDGEVELLPGSPLMAVFPFKRDEWVMEARVRPHRDEERGLMAHRLIAAYRTFFHQKKSYK